ncbi:MAG: hypothetical protein HYS08_01540 [Chlamydiae bacterium]|nr:hypothetical protein [Chlamydiota bacterium]MBI3267262.1 hypothetical protein [Chlamydiota bacterium]
MKTKVIAVLGMHRSGTSVITRALNLGGVYLGEPGDLMEGASDNSEGFWEHKGIVDLNERILQALKRTWDSVLPLPHEWHLSKDFQPFKSEMVRLIKSCFLNRPLWGWKDPRTSLTFDLWKEALRELGMDCVSLVMIRNPLDVAKSLLKRNGFSQGKSFGMWLHYNLSILQTTQGLQRTFLFYDLFLENWEKEMKNCFSKMGLDWPRENNVLNEEMNALIRLDLRHSQSKFEELKKREASLPLVTVYEFLEMLSQSSQDSVFQMKIETGCKDFLNYARYFQEDIESLWKEKQQCQILGQHLLKVEKALLEAQQALILQQKELQAFLNSRSWKLTAPLRMFSRLLRFRK